MTTVASVAPAYIVAEYDPATGRGWNASGTVLRQTRDDGATWTDLFTFSGESMEGVTYLADGELLISTTNAQSVRRVHRTTGLAAGTVTTSVVLTGRAPGIKFPTSWSVSTHQGVVVLGEYGPKVGEPWPGVAEVLPGENARYVYLSTDHGRTFATVFDLNAYLTDTQGRSSVNGHHVHGVAWDPYWHRLWVTVGDTTDGIIYSDDTGVTWRTAHYNAAAATNTQVVGIMPLPTCVLFGSDTGVGGVLRLDRAELTAEAYTLETAYSPGGDGKWLAQAVHRNGPGEPALFGFCAEGAPNRSYVVATTDGQSFTEVWRDDVDQAAGFGTRTVVGPTERGSILIGSNDQKTAGMWSQVSVPYRPGNRVPNASAEVDLTGWVKGTGATLARRTGTSAHGGAYVESTIAPGTVAFNSRIVQDAPLAPGDAGQWLGWALSLRGAAWTGRYRQVMTFFNGTTQISQHLGGTAPVPTAALTDAAARATYAIQVPAGATRCELRVLFYSDTLGDPPAGTVHTDAWTAVAGADATTAQAAARTFYATTTEPATPTLWRPTPGLFVGPRKRPARVRGLIRGGAEVAVHAASIAA